MAQELEEAQVATEELQLELMRKEQAFRRKQEEPEDYLGHLQKAQRNFEQHKQQIQVLFDQLRDQKETELRLIESNRAHEQAEQQLQEFQALLIQKEQEVQLLRHQLQLAEEKNSRLAAAQSEFEQLNQELQQISEQHQKLNNQLLRIKEIDAILTQLTQKGE